MARMERGPPKMPMLGGDFVEPDGGEGGSWGFMAGVGNLVSDKVQTTLRVQTHAQIIRLN